MKFRPLHDRIVVTRIDAEGKTAGGIIIPDTAKEKPQEGKVIALGTGKRDEDGKLIPFEVKKGDRVLIGCSLTPASALVYLGAMYAGLVAVPVEDREIRESARTLLKVTGAKAVWTETVVRARETDAGNCDEGSVLWLQGEPAAELSAMISPAACVASDLAALMATPGTKPKPPENPMSADRVRWEHIQRIYEMCNRNVSETARRLNMHRRTLQRILAKRAPR